MNKLVECRSFDVSPLHERPILVSYIASYLHGNGVEVSYTALTEANDSLQGSLYAPFRSHEAIRAAITRDLRLFGSNLIWN